MKKLIPLKTAGNIVLILFGLLLIFHILILLQALPSDMVWGGMAAEESADPVILETVALIITLLFMFIIAAKTGYFRKIRSGIVINIGVWIIFIYLLLNTLGNLASDVKVENFIFAPLTIIMALLTLRLAIEK